MPKPQKIMEKQVFKKREKHEKNTLKKSCYR